VIVGYFSAKQKDFAVRMDAAAADLTARGARVVGRVVQRRGVSDGGVRRMTLPYSSRTLLSSGKTREVAALREESGADAVIFLNALTEHQRRVLTEAFGCPAVSLAKAPAPGRAGQGLSDNSRLPADAMHALSPHRAQTQVHPVRGSTPGTPRART